MPVARKRKSSGDRDGYWYEAERHKNQQRNLMLFETPGWTWCDSYSFYRALFPAGFLQSAGDDADGKPNIIVLEDTGRDIELKADSRGNQRVKRVMHRYTVHDDLEELERLRRISIRENTFMFLSPVSYYGKSRASKNARYLHAMMIDLDFVGETELANLLHQMERGVIPYANYLVSSGTGLHVVYMFDKPVPLMKRYVPGLQIIKRELTDRVWNAHTSASDPDKKQSQGIFQGFRMVGSATKLNGDIGKPKLSQPYTVECFCHNSTPPATIPYLLSFVPKLKDKADLDALRALQAITDESKTTTPLPLAKELWPEWHEHRVVGKKPKEGWVYGRCAYDQILEVITEQASVSHRYWCLFYLAVMANKCGVSYEELEDDAYGLLDRFDALSIEPGNRFTANDVAAALEAYENGKADGRSRRYTQEFCERKAAVHYGKKHGHGSNPPEKRLPVDMTLRKARMVRDLNQELKGRNWWDDGNRNGAPTKAMQVWEVAYEHPDMNVTDIARAAGVSRPTVYKWLSVEDWRGQYERCLKLDTDEEYRESFLREIVEEQLEEERNFLSEYYAAGGGFEQDIIESVIKFPWKSYDEIAAMWQVEDGKVVKDVVDSNPDLYNKIKLGLMEAGKDTEYELIRLIMDGVM